MEEYVPTTIPIMSVRAKRGSTSLTSTDPEYVAMWV